MSRPEVPYDDDCTNTRNDKDAVPWISWWLYQGVSNQFIQAYTDLRIIEGQDASSSPEGGSDAAPQVQPQGTRQL